MPHTVLVVDDDANLLAGFRRAHYRQPFRVLTAESASAAFALLAEQPVDVLVSDHEMPGMLGIDFVVEVRHRYPDVVSIILTGHADLRVAMDAINAGEVFRFFTKPCDPEDLALSIHYALQQKELIQHARRLLLTVRRQGAALARDGERAAAAAEVPAMIVLDDAPVDLGALLREVQAELDAAEERLARRTPETAAG
jgi:DNA-binding NtrC family response regulator